MQSSMGGESGKKRKRAGGGGGGSGVVVVDMGSFPEGSGTSFILVS